MPRAIKLVFMTVFGVCLLGLGINEANAASYGSDPIDVHIDQHFTNAEVNEILDRSSSFQTLISAIGLVTSGTPAGIATFLTGLSYEPADHFKEASRRGTGLTISYDYYDDCTATCGHGRISNKSVAFE